MHVCGACVLMYNALVFNPPPPHVIPMTASSAIVPKEFKRVCIVCVYMSVTNRWTTNHWTGLDWNPKISFTLRGYAIEK